MQSKPNPFQPLITACGNDPVLCSNSTYSRTNVNKLTQKRLQDIYEQHRLARNSHFKVMILNPNFPGWQIDEVLRKLVVSGENELDSRNNLTFVVRPPEHIKSLIFSIQQQIQEVAPSLSLPISCTFSVSRE